MLCNTFFFYNIFQWLHIFKSSRPQTMQLYHVSCLFVPYAKKTFQENWHIFRYIIPNQCHLIVPQQAGEYSLFPTAVSEEKLDEARRKSSLKQLLGKIILAPEKERPQRPDLQASLIIQSKAAEQWESLMTHSWSERENKETGCHQIHIVRCQSNVPPTRSPVPEPRNPLFSQTFSLNLSFLLFHQLHCSSFEWGGKKGHKWTMTN